MKRDEFKIHYEENGEGDDKKHQEIIVQKIETLAEVLAKLKKASKEKAQLHFPFDVELQNRLWNEDSKFNFMYSFPNSYYKKEKNAYDLNEKGWQLLQNTLGHDNPGVKGAKVWHAGIASASNHKEEENFVSQALNRRGNVRAKKRASDSFHSTLFMRRHNDWIAVSLIRT